MDELLYGVSIVSSDHIHNASSSVVVIELGAICEVIISPCSASLNSVVEPHLSVASKIDLFVDLGQDMIMIE